MNLQVIQIALLEYGLREIPGASSNPEILQMAKDCGFTDYTNDDISWCSLFVNWVAWKALCGRSKSLAARSWLTVGVPVAEPELGDVVIFWRIDPHGIYGHVGFYIGRRNGLIYVLGGNEGNMVQIEGFDPSKVLGYIRLVAAIS